MSENKCMKCGNAIGNDVFTVCDNCWDLKSSPTPKQKLIEAVTERRESAIDASIKFRAMINKRDAYIVSKARANLYDEFLELIQEILPN